MTGFSIRPWTFLKYNTAFLSQLFHSYIAYERVPDKKVPWTIFRLVYITFFRSSYFKLLKRFLSWLSSHLFSQNACSRQLFSWRAPSQMFDRVLNLPLEFITLPAVNYYHKALHRRCCSSPRSASAYLEK